jgi:hypothetical protein
LILTERASGVRVAPDTISFPFISFAMAFVYDTRTDPHHAAQFAFSPSLIAHARRSYPQARRGRFQYSRSFPISPTGFFTDGNFQYRAVAVARAATTTTTMLDVYASALRG